MSSLQIACWTFSFFFPQEQHSVHHVMLKGGILVYQYSSKWLSGGGYYGHYSVMDNLQVVEQIGFLRQSKCNFHVYVNFKCVDFVLHLLNSCTATHYVSCEEKPLETMIPIEPMKKPIVFQHYLVWLHFKSAISRFHMHGFCQ